MSYMVGIFCDGPGCKECAGCWENFTVNQTSAMRTAREQGWSVGKKGWLCPKCRRKGKGKNDAARNT